MSVYNGDKHLADAIESILNQTYSKFEFIIIDDGSNDNSLNIIQHYARKDHRVIPFKQENMGLTKSLNNGIALARGKYIARQDADDLSMNNRLELQVDKLNKNPDYGLIGSCAIVIDDSGKTIKEARVPLVNHRINTEMKYGNVFIHGSVMFTKKIFDNAGGYNPLFKYSQDYDLWLRLIKVTKAFNLREKLYQLRISEDSISNVNRDSQLNYAAIALYHNKYCLNSSYCNDTLILKDKKWNKIVARLALRRGEYNMSLSYYKKFLSLESILFRILLKYNNLTTLIKYIYKKIKIFT